MELINDELKVEFILSFLPEGSIKSFIQPSTVPVSLDLSNVFSSSKISWSTNFKTSFVLFYFVFPSLLSIEFFEYLEFNALLVFILRFLLSIFWFWRFICIIVFFFYILSLSTFFLDDGEWLFWLNEKSLLVKFLAVFLLTLIFYLLFSCIIFWNWEASLN